MPKKDNPDRPRTGKGRYEPTPDTPLPPPINPGSHGTANDEDETEDWLRSKSRKSPFDTTLPATTRRDDDASEILKRFNI